MTERLVSPDLRLWFIADNEDLKPIKALYGLSKSQKGNIKQLLGWKNVGNGRGDRNGRDERKKAKNWVLFHSVSWLKHDDGTEYVPLVCNLDHKFSVVAGRPDKYIGSMGSLRNLLNGLKAHIGRWRKGGRERCTSQLHKTPSQIALLALCCKNSSAGAGQIVAPCGARYPSRGEARRKRLQIRRKSTKTRSSPWRFWNSRSRSSILNGAPVRQTGNALATGEQWLLPPLHSSSGAWLKPCPWLGTELG
jgi:hypothetical protein